MAQWLTRLAFDYLTMASEVVGLNPPHDNSWLVLRGCPEMTLAVDLDVKPQLCKITVAVNAFKLFNVNVQIPNTIIHI